ncbi:hypothetical protein CL684_01270 [Candidatus Campbellbacteria bacterium]|nr:hypothetical protein [Candidatus Campbellbacteria bacterium]|tara:strand:- start:623 stop:1129 length:507 start_codon:yes stop_codon:yes gene_type:complete
MKYQNIISFVSKALANNVIIGVFVFTFLIATTIPEVVELQLFESILQFSLNETQDISIDGGIVDAFLLLGLNGSADMFIILPLLGSVVAFFERKKQRSQILNKEFYVLSFILFPLYIWYSLYIKTIALVLFIISTSMIGLASFIKWFGDIFLPKLIKETIEYNTHKKF